MRPCRKNVVFSMVFVRVLTLPYHSAGPEKYSSLILSEEYFYVCRESLYLQLWVMRPTSVARWETPPSAAGGGYSEEGVCAAVEKIERANSAKIFSGTARGAKR